MRKLARVGRPASRPPSSARTSASRSSRSPAGVGGRGARQLALELGELPGVVGRYVGQVADAGAQRHHPVRHRAGVAQRAQAPVEPVDQLGEPAGEVDLVAADVVERQAGAEVAVVVVAHRDAEQDPVEPGAPGVLGEPLHRERRARVLVEPPADAGARHPAADPLEVVVGEAEPSAERLRRRRSSTSEAVTRPPLSSQQHARDGQQRVGADQRAVGQPDPQPVRRVHADGASPSGPPAARTRPRSAARRSRCRGTSRGCRAARASGRPRAGRPAPRAARRPGATGRGRRAPGGSGRPGRGGGRRARRPPARGWRRGRAGASPSRVGRRRRPAGARRRPTGTGRRRASGAARARRGPSEASRGWPTSRADSSSSRGDHPAASGEGVPERGRRLREPQVDVAVLAERGEQVDLGRRQPGVPEQRQPARQVEAGAAGAQRRDRRGVPHVGRRRVDAGQQPPPQLGLPGEVGVEVAAGPVGVAALAPVGDEARAAGRRTTRTAPRAGSPRCSGGCGAARGRGPSARGRGGRPGSRTRARRGWRR